jgi:S1-C subfamily serine protease
MVPHAARRFVVFTIVLLLLGVGFLLGSATVMTNASNLNFVSNVAQLQANTANNQQQVVESERVYADIYNRVSPSVVSINVVSRVPGTGLNSEDEFSEGTGTGFVIDETGHIVTNNHVVIGANRIEVNFFDGTIVRAETVGFDPDSDLAVLQVDLPAESLYPVTFADSSSLYVGQSVAAIGSPFGQPWTMTTGIVSAVDRTIQGLGQYQIGSVIQTDAAINPGNSGGPLLDLQGNVVGVNSQIISRSRSSSGIGFAIPSNLVQRVAEELISSGHVSYSFLGIESRPTDVDLALIEAMQLPNNTRGVVIQGVSSGGPAAQAGLRNPDNWILVDGIQVPSSADIIIAIDGQPITGFNTLIAYLSSQTQPGQTVTLTVLRNGQQVQLPLVLGERPSSN